MNLSCGNGCVDVARRSALAIVWLAIGLNSARAQSVPLVTGNPRVDKAAGLAPMFAGGVLLMRDEPQELPGLRLR